MFDDLGDGRLHDITVAFGQIETSLARFLRAASGENDEVSIGEVLVPIGRDEAGIGVKREAVFEICFLTLGFLDFAAKKDEVGRDTFEKEGIGGRDADAAEAKNSDFKTFTFEH